MAGYSKKGLLGKLGIKSGQTILFLNPPSDYSSELGALPEKVELKHELAGGFHLIQFFTKHKSELEEKLPLLKASLVDKGMLWVSWPKKAANVDTDITEDVIRAAAIKNGMVDVKVCAVNDIWSGLKLVRKKAD
ncbi:MAG: DUF3052 family protein [Leptospirales bacterium]|nr:DUF3052 family protein [Leptospirales bacterium]